MLDQSKQDSFLQNSAFASYANNFPQFKTLYKKLLNSLFFKKINLIFIIFHLKREYFVGQFQGNFQNVNSSAKVEFCCSVFHGIRLPR